MAKIKLIDFLKERSLYDLRETSISYTQADGSDEIEISDGELSRMRAAPLSVGLEDAQNLKKEAEEAREKIGFVSADDGVVNHESRIASFEQKTNSDKAFALFIGSFSIKGSYPAKQDAMEKAVSELGDDAPSSELFERATEILNKESE